MSETSTLAKIALGGLNILTKIGGWIMPVISAIGTFISGIMEGSAIAEPSIIPEMNVPIAEITGIIQPPIFVKIFKPPKAILASVDVSDMKYNAELAALEDRKSVV